ncbi:hypothetical protein [Bergeyella sp. RCAD1439]|uniref:hypothetical protein n=1 Tax=Bergeyella anatis TaxID=3113737 RepID=UPI002E199D39|nr:hypothetical protein [Bergeyella sp. RCAD1439]
MFFVASLFFNGLVVQDYDGVKKYNGLELFVLGFLSFWGGGILEFLVWLANPLALFAFFFFKKKPKWRFLFALISFGLAISFAGWEQVLISENGRQGEIMTLGAAYWFWVLTLMLVLVLSGFGLMQKSKEGAE